MKTITFLIIATMIGLMTQAQSVLRYEFLNSLNEKNGSGPTLSILGNPGSYVLDTLNEIQGNTRTVYRFETNSGFQFDNTAAGNFIGTSYTIELYFVFDNLTSWKRVVDWKNRKTDYGAYVYYGELNFYPFIYSGEAPVEPGEYTYYVITRDAATNKVLIYADAKVEIEFTDSNGDALVDGDNFVNFFQDDLSVPNEASSGAVAMLNIYSYVLDSNSIKQNYENLAGQVFAVNENSKQGSRLQLYPNPAVEQVTVDLSGFNDRHVDVSVFNAAGIKVHSELIMESSKNSFVMNTENFPVGIYLVRAESAKQSFSRKLLILK
jgi:hypothetical protein